MGQVLKILIVEDDQLERSFLASLVRKEGQVSAVSTRQMALQAYQNELHDLVFMDMDLSTPLEGLEIINELLELGSPYVIVLSGREDDRTIQSAYQAGCRDYLCKPITAHNLEMVLKKFRSHQSLDNLSEILAKKFITSNPQLIGTLSQLKDAQCSELPIFISGPSGTGKTLMAKLIHEMSGGKDEQFIHLNCSELPESLLESELFGYEKGAFTGAERKKKGLLELANGGTLFLDEVATMPTNLQKKLLRVLEDKDFYPLGSETKVRTQFRLIAATCEDLEDLVMNKQFRSDLFFRLQGVQIELPALSERKQDIPQLVRHFLKQANRKVVLTKEAIDLLVSYSWPGNIRELKKVIELLSTRAEGIITENALPDAIKGKSSKATNIEGALEFLTDSQWALVQDHGLKTLLETLETECLKKAMEKNDGKVRASMRELKISSNAFYSIVQKIQHRPY